jgi:DNA repair photolyase
MNLMEVTEIQASSILTPQKVGSLAGHYDYSLNPYAGCAFRCSYCYVPKFPSKRHDDFQQWGKWVEVKINAPELIREQRSQVFGSSIFFSSATDPYQYLELKYRLTRQCLLELLKYKPAKLTMHTRSHLILQDLDILKQFGDRVRVGVSFTTDDEMIRREFEPGAPSLARRLEVLRTLKEAGVRTHASLSPLLPCDPERLAAMLKPLVDTVWIDSMRNLEINNRKDLLHKHAHFFKPTSYERVQKWLFDEITNRHPPHTSAARKSTYDFAARSRQTDHKEKRQGGNSEVEDKQLRLLLTNV